MTRADTDGFVAILKTGPHPIAVIVGEDTGRPAPPYALVYAPLDSDRQESLTGSYGPRDVTHTVHFIGSTYDQARSLADRGDAKLRPKGRGVRPDVVGRNCGPIRREVARGPVNDDDVQDNLFDAISEYEFRSRPK